MQQTLDLKTYVELLRAERGDVELLFAEDIRETWRTHAQERYEARISNMPLGPASGFARLDEELGGFFCPGVHIVGGAPGAGKSAFCLQLASQCGYPALVISCELDVLDMWHRTAARTTGTSLRSIKRGELCPQQSMKLLDEAIASAPMVAMVNAMGRCANPLWIIDAARKCKERYKKDKVLIVVDSLHKWVNSFPSNDSEYDRLGYGIVLLEALAAELDGPVLCIAERNRANQKEGGMDSAAGNRTIEYSAQSLIELNKGEDAVCDPGQRPVRLRLTKNRNGLPDTCIEMLFDGARMEFREDDFGI